MTSAPVPDWPTLLAVNAGSSSIKLGVFRDADPPTRTLIQSLPYAGDIRASAAAAVQWVEQQLDPGALVGIGHRVVLSARRPLVEPVTPVTLDALRDAGIHEPEHLPLQVALIEAFATRSPAVPCFVCFDSAFHDTMPRRARLLPLPARLQAVGFERFGFHGLSCAYLMEELARTAGAEAAAGRVILAHLGNGASVTAVRHGRSIDTSMGFTPAGGLVMATRSGDLDPGVVEAICRAERLAPAGFNRLVNQEAGLLGISGTTGDIRELLARAPDDRRADDAVDLFCYQARKWIGAFAAALGGLDTLVFAGGIGEHLPEVRGRICRDLEFLGIDIDTARNGANLPVISTEGSRAAVRVIRTDEEAMIARATSRALRNGGAIPSAQGRP